MECDSADPNIWLADEAIVATESYARQGEATLLADVDADGSLEAIGGAPGANQVTIQKASGETLTLTSPDDTAVDLGKALGFADLEIDDGAGVPELLVGAPAGDSGTPGVYILAGPLTAGGELTDLAAVAPLAPDGTSALVAASVPHVAEGDLLGSAFSAGADFNDDGVADLLVGAPGKPDDSADGLTDVGFAFFFLGPIGGFTPGVTFTIEPGVSGDVIGHDDVGAAVALADVDGDGHGDMVVGAPSTDTGLAGSVGVERAQDVHLEDGGVSVRHDDILVNLSAEESGDAFGSSISADDWDGDGYDDVMIGAPGADGTDADTPNGGAVWLYLGGADFDGRGEVVQFRGTTSGGAAGTAVALTPDGSAFQGLLIGAPGEVDVVAGKVYLLEGDRTGVVELARSDALATKERVACDPLVPHEPDGITAKSLYGYSLSATISTDNLLFGVGAPDYGEGGAAFFTGLTF